MTSKMYFGLRTLTIISVLLLFSACASSPPSRFYTLTSLRMQKDIQDHIVEASSYSLVVGPVTIPDYMDRPQIITRSSTYEIHLDEFNPWASPLDEDITQVLTENLSVLLSQEKISISQWQYGSTAKYQVPIDVRRFDVMPDGNVLLIAKWSVIDQKEKQTLTALEAKIKEPIDGQDYNAKVSAMSKAIEALSRNIADAIKLGDIRNPNKL
jgi:uncharacterized lipoprotein YmbA